MSFYDNQQLDQGEIFQKKSLFIEDKGSITRSRPQDAVTVSLYRTELSIIPLAHLQTSVQNAFFDDQVDSITYVFWGGYEYKTCLIIPLVTLIKAKIDKIVIAQARLARLWRLRLCC